MGRRREIYNLSHDKLLSFNLGQLVPIMAEEVLPGDTWIQESTGLFRFSPLVKPVMGKVWVDIAHFYTPWRQVWEDFEKFITGGMDGMDASVLPTRSIDTGNAAFSYGSLADYLGVPSDKGVATMNVLLVRVYQNLWNNYYRDQLLQAEAAVSKASGNDVTTEWSLKRACWNKDYFSTLSPDTQLGDEVSVDLSGSTVSISGAGTQAIPDLDIKFRDGPGGTGTPYNNLLMGVGSPAAQPVTTDPGAGWPDSSGLYGRVEGAGFSASSMADKLSGELDAGAEFTIRQLRVLSALQRFKERRMQIGGRYTELLRSLGVDSPDSRLQRPELLGRGRQTMKFSEVLQTGPDSADEGVASLKGHAITGVRTNGYKRFFSEHGCVMTVACVRPQSIYMSGLRRFWNKSTKEDFWEPELENVGMQVVKQREVMLEGATNPDFGYQPKYEEYRHGISSVSGDFRNTEKDWHFGRDYATAPVLNDEWVECVPSERVFADQLADNIQAYVHHRVKAARLVGRPGAAGRLI